jgi:ribosome assembly protein RRB1
MGKKSKRVRSSGGNNARAAPAHRQPEEETAENLRFEDPHVDEIVEDDDDLVDEDDDDAPAAAAAKLSGGGDEDGMELVQSWHPLMGGVPPDEPLEMDPAAYKMYHTLSPEWPSLSFDFIRDTLGDARQRFPHSLQAVFGTQADSPDNNQLTVIKLSDLAKLPQEDDEEDILNDDDEKDDNGSSSSSDDEDLDLDPIMEHYSLPHYGGVNRVRAMPQGSDIVATWSDVGKVNIYNISHLLARFQASEGRGSSNTSTQGSSKPTFSYSGHGVEGYALDWSSVSKGHLATGDNNGNIHLWKPRSDGTYEVTPSYESTGSGVSVEEIQWSPSESTVFCAAETGGYLSIYDTRAPHRSMLRHLCHDKTKADVNVASWNHLVSNLLATGGDDGTLSVWDLRQLSPKADKSAAPLARFSCHKTPITSVEWHPTDESMLAVSDTVGAYIYDLSVEEDTSAPTNTLVADIPPQLLFCHSGSQDFKELHWHPQISSCVMTTAYSGFSVFIPSNL